MDPFEVRVRFTQLLANLNASVTSATKTAQYAIKYRDLDEDLHSCIIEQLEKVGVKSPECSRRTLLICIATKYNEQPRKHHVLPGTPLRERSARESRRLYPNDAARYPANG